MSSSMGFYHIIWLVVSTNPSENDEFVSWDDDIPILFPYPIGSMYAIYGNIYHQYTPNVTIYSIHGSYGIYYLLKINNMVETTKQFLRSRWNPIIPIPWRNQQTQRPCHWSAPWRRDRISHSGQQQADHEHGPAMGIPSVYDLFNSRNM